MDSEENKKQLTNNQQELNDLSEQNSIIENDYIDINNEITKIILQQKDFDEETQNEIFDNVQNLLNNPINQEKHLEEDNNICYFQNKIKQNKNQKNIFHPLTIMIY